MKKIGIFTVLGLLFCIQSYAQYFNVPFFKTGFDDQTEFDAWKEETTPAAGSETDLWQLKNNSQAFSEIDNTSTNSLYFKIGSGTKCLTTLTSPEINTSGKKGLILGFYHANMRMQSAQKIYFHFEITVDNGVTWETLFNSETDAYKGALMYGWRNCMYYLPGKYDNKKIKLRLKVDATGYTGFSSQFVLDGLYLSTRYPDDAIAKWSNLQNPDTRFTTYDKVFTHEEPVTVKIGNNGTNDIRTIDISYQIDDRAPVKETFTPSEPIRTGDSAVYTFKAKADLGAFRTTYNVKLWTDLSADMNRANDSITEKLQNVLTDVPYVPTFWFEKNGYINLDTDQWNVDQDFGTGEAVWRTSSLPKPGYWFVNFEKATLECKAVVRSRPVYFKTDEPYEFRFNAYSEMTLDQAADEAKKNKLVIYLTQDPEGLEGLTEIWRNESIDKVSGMDSQVRFTVPRTGAYYFAFKCLSPITASELRIRDFYFVTAPKADAKLLDIATPVSSKYLFGKNEPVKISLVNNGIEPIASNELKVSVQLNDGPVMTETVSDAVPVGGKLDYTFKGTLDLTDLTRKHDLSIWTELPGDENLRNDTIRRTLVNTVAGIPYAADFTTNAQGEFSQEKSFWEVVDGNGDNHAFVAEKEQWADRFTFKYGGNSAEPAVVIPTTDETLYSRPMMLHAGSNYRIQHSANVMSGSGTDKSFDAKIGLYKLDGDTKTEVKVMYDDKLASYNTFEHIVDIKENGAYVVGYHLSKSTPVDYYVKISNLKVTKTADYDIALDNILFGGKYLSGYKTLPLGVSVSNPGIRTIESFTVSASSPSIGTKTQTFRKSIKPLESTFVYLDENITLSQTENETITVTVTMDNDGFESNNTKTLSVSYLENAVLPYSADFVEKEGFVSLDLNKDAKMFKPYVNSETLHGIQVETYRYSLSSSAGENSDQLLSRSLNLQAGKVYKISFGTTIDQNNFIPSMEVSALNIADGTRISITKLLNYSTYYGATYQYTGYFTVPEEGVYCISFGTLDGEIGLTVRDKLTIEEVSEKPDIRVTGIKSPAAEALLGEEETIVATVKNEGNLILNGTMFSCQVNDTILYNCITDELTSGEEAEISFGKLNLYEPGDYAVTVKAETATDQTPENNVFMQTIKSLPVVEMQLVSKDSPLSGALKEQEPIVVTVRNNGKGVMTDIPVHYSITHLESKTVVKADETIRASVAKDRTYQFTFEKKADLSAEGTYEIVVYTAMPGETVLSNDTVRANVVSTHKAFDAGVSAVTDPADGLLTAAEMITVEVKNFGEVDLYDVPVCAVVTKGETVVKELTGNVPECKTGAKAIYTFTETADLYPYGEYTITAYTRAVNDSRQQNDTCRVNVKSLKLDCGVTEIVAPEAECPLGMQVVTVVVKNFGEVEITQIPVRFKVGSMPQNGIVEQTLQPGESVTYTFPAEYNFRSEKAYTLTAYTELETDMDRENDAVSKTIQVVTGIDSPEKTRLTVYPNPVKEVIHIKADGELLKSVTLYDQAGVVLALHAGLQTDHYSLQLGELPGGVYLLSIETQNDTFVRKVFKD